MCNGLFCFNCVLHIKIFILLHGRHQDIATRSRYVRLVDNVKENGGNVRYSNDCALWSYYCYLCYANVLALSFFLLFNNIF